MKTVEIPQSVRVTLWSYDVDRMDIDRDKDLIITQVLNYGTKEATDWLRETYSREDIAKNIAHPRAGQWNKKSLNFWSIVFDVKPEIISRF